MPAIHATVSVGGLHGLSAETITVGKVSFEPSVGYRDLLYDYISIA